MMTTLTIRVDDVVSKHIKMCMAAQGTTMQTVLGEIVLTWVARDCPNRAFPGGHPKVADWGVEGESKEESGKRCKPVSGDESIFPEEEK